MAKRKPARRSERPRTASKKPAVRRARTAGSASSRTTGTSKRRARRTSASPVKTVKAKTPKPPKRAQSAKRAPAKATKAARKATLAAPKRAARAAPRRSGAPRAAAKSRDKAVDPLAGKTPRLERVRRTLDETVQSPPSSLDMERRGSSVRTGRAEMAQARENLGDMGALTRGDVDADAENAYFSGDEAPGGDNPTPDQDIVDDIGRALGVEYQDNEELRASDKVVERDKHRWELDPASSEDYKDRK